MGSKGRRVSRKASAAGANPLKEAGLSQDGMYGLVQRGSRGEKGGLEGGKEGSPKVKAKIVGLQ